MASMAEKRTADLRREWLDSVFRRGGFCPESSRREMGVQICTLESE